MHLKQLPYLKQVMFNTAPSPAILAELRKSLPNVAVVDAMGVAFQTIAE